MKKLFMFFSTIIYSYCLAEKYSQINANFSLDKTALVCDKTKHDFPSPCNTATKKNKWRATQIAPYPPYNITYIDEYPIQKINGSSALVIEQIVLTKSRPADIMRKTGKNYKVLFLLMKYDCKKQIKFMLSEEKYDKFGKHIDSFNYENSNGTPDNTGFYMERDEYDVICNTLK